MLRSALPALAFGCLALAGCQSEQRLPVAETSPSAVTPFYVGVWAAAQTACGHEVYVFTANGVTSPEGESYAFQATTQTATGYDITVVPAGGNGTPSYAVHLSFAQSTQALLVDGAPFAPPSLVRCS